MIPPRQELDARAVAGVRELSATLAGLQLEPSGVLDSALEQLRELLGARITMTYRAGVDEVRGRMAVDFMSWAGPVTPSMHQCIVDWVGGLSVPWGAYNPTRPEPRQRNRIWRVRHLIGDEAYSEMRIYRELFPKLGFTKLDEMRTLTCDGPILLGWVGGFRVRHPRQGHGRPIQCWRNLRSNVQPGVCVRAFTGRSELVGPARAKWCGPGRGHSRCGER